MKLRISPILISTLTLAFAPVASQAADPDDQFLLKTQWYQDGPFAQFTPSQERLGCWSTAYAQILYFHQLKPTGRVTYDCSSGLKIDIDFDQYEFDWAKFPDVVTPTTPKESIGQAARFSFATAAVVHKDFGTDRYKRMLSSVKDLEAHFPVDAEIYVYLCDKPPIPLETLAAQTRSEGISNVVDRAQIVSLLTKELDARRPVYFYFGNLRGFGHATVIDGMRLAGDRHLVHINFGDVALKRNRWYDLFAPLEVPDDDTLRAFVTIRPLRPRPPA